ncbi:MAG TPA: hypothetical protein VE860_05105 [Chthoniobacterales bacterium]|jgi:hypothetical protein|nr:hypothetical protein [Chthoniobacterales bacterium]
MTAGEFLGNLPYSSTLDAQVAAYVGSTPLGQSILLLAIDTFIRSSGLSGADHDAVMKEFFARVQIAMDGYKGL